MTDLELRYAELLESRRHNEATEEIDRQRNTIEAANAAVSNLNQAVRNTNDALYQTQQMKIQHFQAINDSAIKIVDAVSGMRKAEAAVSEAHTSAERQRAENLYWQGTLSNSAMANWINNQAMQADIQVKASEVGLNTERMKSEANQRRLGWQNLEIQRRQALASGISSFGTLLGGTGRFLGGLSQITKLN